MRERGGRFHGALRECMWRGGSMHGYCSHRMGHVERRRGTGVRIRHEHCEPLSRCTIDLSSDLDA